MCHNPQMEWKLNLDKNIYIRDKQARDKEKKKKNNNQPEKGRRKVRTGKNGRAKVVRE